MSSQHAPHSKLRTAFRWIAISLTVIVATWLIVIFWWQLTQRVVTTSDAIFQLAILPLALLLAIGLIRWRISAKSAGVQVQSLAPDAPPAGPAGEFVTAEPKKTAIMAAWSITSLAPDAQELVENLSERRSRPTPDELLTNCDGFPLLTGRVKDLATESIADILQHIDAKEAQDDMLDAKGMRDALLRTLALLESVLRQVIQDWPLPAGAVEDSQEHAATLRGASGLPATEATSLDLRVTLLLSNELTTDETRLAQAYVAMRLTKLDISDQVVAVDIIATDDDATALTLAEEFALQAANDLGKAGPRALLLLAADSALCSTIAEPWDEQGRLFESRRPNGIMLGEAAFGVLFANERAHLEAGLPPICHLAPVVRMRRTGDSETTSTHQSLVRAIATALQAAAISGDAVGTVVCDADHRTSRTLESIEAMLDQTPRLDAIQHRLAISEACGHLGAASVLGVMAAGAIQAGNTARPVLIFNVSHPSERAAAVLLPADTEHDHAQTLPLKAA